mgnify:FL=1
MDRSDLGALFAGLRATVTIADEDGRIVFLNDRAVAHYADRGGRELIGTHLNDCHNPTSQKKIHQMYTRYRAGDLSPTRYHQQQGDSTALTIVVLPIVVEGEFRGIAELMWNERPEFVFET